MRARSKVLASLLIPISLLGGIVMGNPDSRAGNPVEIRIESSAFESWGMIPRKYTCDGADVSPPLAWYNVPAGTMSLALITDDPDAPAGNWVHWVIYNLPPTVLELPENVPPRKTLANGSRQGTNDFRNTGYGGPCPPSGTHRYYFKIYALDTVLDCSPGVTKTALLSAMEGHILASGQLVGKYKR